MTLPFDPHSTPSLHIIVLAAGRSQRLGSPKQLIPVCGTALLDVMVSRATEVAGNRVTVVLGAHGAEFARLLQHSAASVVINQLWREGLASSIRAGITSLPAHCTGAMLLLADQFAITAADLRHLKDAWHRQPTCRVAAEYADTIGVPAIFPHTFFDQLKELRGDNGARVLLLRDPSEVVRVRIESAALDLDTPEQLASLPPARPLGEA